MYDGLQVEGHHNLTSAELKLNSFDTKIAAN